MLFSNPKISSDELAYVDLYNKQENIIDADIQSLFVKRLTQINTHPDLKINGISLFSKQSIIDQVYPIGTTYEQYPESDGSWVDSKTPKRMWGGEWVLLFGDGSFFRTEGGLSQNNRTNGIQESNLQSHTHTVSIDHTHTFTYDEGGTLNSSGRDSGSTRHQPFDSSGTIGATTSSIQHGEGGHSSVTIKNMFVKIWLKTKNSVQ